LNIDLTKELWFQHVANEILDNFDDHVALFRLFKLLNAMDQEGLIPQEIADALFQKIEWVIAQQT